MHKHEHHKPRRKLPAPQGRIDPDAQQHGAGGGEDFAELRQRKERLELEQDGNEDGFELHQHHAKRGEDADESAFVSRQLRGRGGGRSRGRGKVKGQRSEARPTRRASCRGRTTTQARGQANANPRRSGDKTGCRPKCLACNESKAYHLFLSMPCVADKNGRLRAYLKTFPD